MKTVAAGPALFPAESASAPPFGAGTDSGSPFAGGTEQLAESVRRQADFLAALNQTTLELLGRRNVSDLLQALVDRAASLLRSPHAQISLLEEGELVLRAFSKGFDYAGGDRVRR